MPAIAHSLSFLTCLALLLFVSGGLSAPSATDSAAFDREWSGIPGNGQNLVRLPSKVRPSRQTLAQYGNDLVLRFNVSSEAEAVSLTDAIDLLYLDLWASGAGWTDVRLAKDVVRQVSAMQAAGSS